MKIRWGWLATAAVVLLFMSCLTRTSLLRDHLKSLVGNDEVVVVVFGDSFSCGTDVSGMGPSYGSYLKPMLSSMFGSSVSMINTSMEEESYRFAHRRIQADIQSYRPDIAFLMLGLYDFLARGVLMSTQRNNIDKFFKNLQKTGTFMVVLTTPGPRGLGGSGNPMEQRLYEINDLIRDYARFYHYPLIDIARYMEKLAMDDHEKYLSLYDGYVKFSEKGKRAIAEYIYSQFATVGGFKQ